MDKKLESIIPPLKKIDKTRERVGQNFRRDQPKTRNKETDVCPVCGSTLCVGCMTQSPTILSAGEDHVVRTSPKLGRPRGAQPWRALGISKSAYYRRKKAGKI